MFGCLQTANGDVLYVGASQNCVRLNKVAVNEDRERRAKFAGTEYAAYDIYIQAKLAAGEQEPLKNCPPDLQTTRNTLEGQLWAVWRVPPRTVKDDPMNYEPMCAAYLLLKNAVNVTVANINCRGCLHLFRARLLGILSISAKSLRLIALSVWLRENT
jgi:hypothetical protein